MLSKIASIKSNLIIGLFSLLLFLTPLIFTTTTKESFEFPKMFFVYFLGSTVIFLFVVKRLLSKQETKKANIFVLSYLVANIISTILSTHLYTSLWGYYSRFNGGLISLLVFFGLYYCAKNTFSKQNFADLTYTSMLSVLPVGLYGVIQHFQLIKNVWEADPSVRVYSTIGQPNWLAAYFVLLLPIIFLHAINNSDQKKNFWAFSFLVGFACLWLTYSISGLLGFGIGLIVLALLNKDLLSNNMKRVGTIVLLAGAFAILRPGVYLARIQDVFVDINRTITIERIAYAQEEAIEPDTYNVSDPGAIRIGLWKGTVSLIVSSPKVLFFGTGPETFPYTFQKFRPLELNYTSEWDFIFNKPHNYYLEVIAETGILGFIPYLGILYFTVKKKDKLLTPGLIAFYITNIFGWPTVTTSLLFWFFLARLDTFE